MNSKTYVDYLSQVLGLSTVMMPTPVGSILETENETEIMARPAFFYSAEGALVEGQNFRQYALAVVNWVREPKESLFEPDVSELFGKMLAAMKIPSSQVLILDCVMNERGLIPNELFKVCDPRCVLFFSAEPVHLGEMQIKGPAKWVETLSPAVLLKEPQSKKLVWNDMQKVMRELSA